MYDICDWGVKQYLFYLIECYYQSFSFQPFLRYMARRCKFLENCYNFLYNMGAGEKCGQTYTSTVLLGKTLISTMLEEIGRIGQQYGAHQSEGNYQV